ncbi:response regulator [Nakamurella silvestris]|nr:response regulator [Nakamurella silvestris]
MLGTRGGMTVEVAPTAHIALQFALRDPYDVVITDIELPGMTGLELVGKLRQDFPDLPIVVMTAHASVDYAVSALRSQVDEFLIKPVPGPELLAKVTALVEKARASKTPQLPVRTILAIGAHPDDVEIGVGGTLAAHRAAGDRVVILTLSRGARGGEVEHRQHESLSAAELIGARLFLEDLEDTRISPTDPTVGIIERVCAEVQPHIVYTHSKNDRHQDHRAVFEAASVATRRVPTFASFESPSVTVDFRPNRFVPIDDFTDTKLALLQCFQSQASIRDYLEPDFVLATARYWSRFGGGKACEPLEVVRDTTGLGAPAWATTDSVKAPHGAVSGEGTAQQ